MLSYQHAFHAGNHADILKHLTLYFVLESLNKKDKSYTYFDTHSGSGLYDLLDNRSQKTGEASRGIVKLLQSESSLENQPLLKSYLSLIKTYSDKNFYPGSPEIARHLCRTQDFMVLSELHPQEIENLKSNMLHPKFDGECKNIQVHNRNGFEMLKALTPPKTKRGAVLIDPSYEETSDYKNVSQTICAVNKKWANGIIMLWYPLLAHRESEINLMLEEITQGARSVNQNVEICDLRLEVASKDSHQEMSLSEYEKSEKNPPRLYGSGMLVINAPWKLEESVLECEKSIAELLRITE